ncbi:hypothetical protein [Geoalkalibacter halelectricus]|uniref:Porin n=1 Tax=Geoalkalibacter halelectricus TaxID=2847045 RepID=A0ABY5ZMK4_9BACT|nr:hypothetical protein [Geoalkalibacter halelectricus]MDO3378731.1 hypothetical protein [Geoalkalibacter halelectricus]UWZ79961.1 hypothetical protein L9S41_00840 [Geoalkalibacter halelectricus]
MKIWQGLTCGLALATLALWPVGDALGAKVSGRTSTVVEWFDSANEHTIVPVFQYLQLNVLDIADQGYDFRMYGRLGDDLAGERNASAKSRLYFAYVEKQGLFLDTLDARLGRQFISTTAGASLMDGLRLDYGFLDNYRLSVFGGGDVTYYEGYNAKDAIVGGEIAGAFLDKNLHLGLSYVSKWDGGNLGQELFGLNAELDLFEALHLYSETQYDYLSDRVSYFLLGAKYYQNPRWNARLEYLYSLPVFSATSIFSVFAVDEYEEILAELNYTIVPGWRAFGRYTHEIYPEFSNANVFEAGIEKLRTARWAGYLSGVYRSDSDGQDLRGFKARGSYLFNQRLLAGAGLEVDVFDRQINFFDIDSGKDETTAKRFWVDGTVFITRAVNLQAKVERIESDLWDYYNRGRIRLNVLF